MKTPHKNLKRSAFTLAELLVAMPIMAILMVSMGAAISGAMNNYEETSQAYSLTQSVRIIGERMTREIRAAENASCVTNALNLEMAGNPDRVIYLLYEGTLYHYQIQDGQTTLSKLLGPADDLTVQSFVIDMTMKDVDGTDYATLITVKISILVDGQTKSFTISASPRKNQTSF